MPKLLLVLAPLLAILALAAWGAWTAWTSAEGGEMSVHGHVAMWLGIVFSFVVGGGLMALLFYSARKGYDERVHDRRFDDEPE